MLAPNHEAAIKVKQDEMGLVAPFQEQPCTGLHGQAGDASHYLVFGSVSLMTWDLYTPDTKGIYKAND